MTTEKAYKVSPFQLRLARSTHIKIREIAQAERRSVNAQLNIIVELGLSELIRQQRQIQK